MPAFFNYSFLDIRVIDFIIIIVCILVAILADKLLQFTLLKIIDRINKRIEDRKAKKLSRSTSLTLSKLIFKSLDRPLHWLMVTVGVSLGLMIMRTPPWGEEIFEVISLILKTLSLWYLVWFMLRVTDQVTHIMTERAKATTDKLDDMLVPIISGVVKVLILSMGVLGMMQNMGYPVTSLVAGLGIGSAAVALAAKDTLANVFGAFVVFFDKPFDVGDWVTINGVEGEIEEIRLRVTLIRTFDNSLVMMPNAVLSNTNINNWQRRNFRKMDCSFGVLYSTTAEQLENIVKDVREYVKATTSIFGPDPRFYINLNGFGDSSFDINVTTFSTAKSYADMLQHKQDFMLAIIKIVEKNGTGFAFPTRTLDMPNNAPIRIKMEN